MASGEKAPRCDQLIARRHQPRLRETATGALDTEHGCMVIAATRARISGARVKVEPPPPAPAHRPAAARTICVTSRPG
ncbi:unnamed protein product, partial [Iphiclides podalirius]